jgi:hypothetical protein
MRLSNFRTHRSLTPDSLRSLSLGDAPIFGPFQPLQLVPFLLAYRESFHPSGLSLSRGTFYLGNISYQTIDLGGGEWRYTYNLNGFDLLHNQFIAIAFRRKPLHRSDVSHHI